jgi:hypothetical protein
MEPFFLNKCSKYFDVLYYLKIIIHGVSITISEEKKQTPRRHNLGGLGATAPPALGPLLPRSLLPAAVRGPAGQSPGSDGGGGDIYARVAFASGSSGGGAWPDGEVPWS